MARDKSNDNAFYKTRTIAIDPETDAMLCEMARGNASAYIRQLILIEYGRRQGRMEAAKHEASVA